MAREKYIFVSEDNERWNRCVDKYGLSEHMLLKLTLALGIDPDPEGLDEEGRVMLGNDNSYWEQVYEFLHAHDLTSEVSWEDWQMLEVGDYVDDPERKDLWMMLSLAKWQNDRRVDDE